MTVVACSRYWLAVLLRSHRHVAPLGLFVLGVVVLTTNDKGPVLGDYAGCAAALFLASLWLTISLLGAEDPVQQSITVVNARGPGRPLAGAIIVIALIALPAVAMGLVVPAVTGDHRVPAAAVAAGAAVQLCAAFTGLAGGLLCSRPVLGHPVGSLGAAIGLVFVAFLVPWVSPLHTALRVSERHRPPDELVAPLVGLGAIAAVLVVGAGLACHGLTVRGWTVSAR